MFKRIKKKFRFVTGEGKDLLLLAKECSGGFVELSIRVINIIVLLVVVEIVVHISWQVGCFHFLVWVF